MKQTYQRFYAEDGSLLYEGFTLANKAYGAGTEYYPDGSPFHEGIFGIKGLLLGREYYPNGKVRFEGVYKLNKAYGPNSPEYGTWYGEDGKELYHGLFAITRGGVGYPTVTTPAGYGPAANRTDLEEHLFMWSDERMLNDPEDKKGGTNI